MNNWILGSDHAFLSLADRGLNYGDGLFETIAVLGQQIFNFDGHYQRLQKGCERLYLSTPNYSELLAQIESLLKSQQENTRSIIKIIITRGESNRGYAISKGTEQTIILRLLDWPDFNKDYYLQGVNVSLSDIRLSHQPLLLGIKHLNRLEQVLASASLDKVYDEALMLDYENNVISAIAGNILWQKNGTIFTPLLDKTGIEGTMLKQIVSFCQQNSIPLEQANYSLENILDAQELLICNSIRGVWPVKSLSYPQGKFNYLSNSGELYQRLLCFNRQLGHS